MLNVVLFLVIRWPTTVTAKPKTSRQKQNTSRQNRKPQGKNKIPHNKTKNLTAKPNTSQQKPNISRQKQIPTTKPKLFWFCCEVFGFNLPWGILFLPWGFWFCSDSCGPPYCKILHLPIRVLYPWKVLSQIVLKKLSARGPPQIMATWKCGVRKASHNDIDDSLVWNQHITWWLVTNRRSACSVIAVHLRLMTESLWSSCFHRKFITTQSNFTSFVAPGASISFIHL